MEGWKRRRWRGKKNRGRRPSSSSSSSFLPLSHHHAWMAATAWLFRVWLQLQGAAVRRSRSRVSRSNNTTALHGGRARLHFVDGMEEEGGGGEKGWREGGRSSPTLRRWHTAVLGGLRLVCVPVPACVRMPWCMGTVVVAVGGITRVSVCTKKTRRGGGCVPFRLGC